MQNQMLENNVSQWLPPFYTFIGKNQMTIVVLQPGRTIYSYGCGLVTLLAGELILDNYTLKDSSWEDFKGLHYAAPFKLCRPATFFAPQTSENDQYKLKRLELRLKEVMDDYDRVIRYIDKGRPTVFLIQPFIRKELKIIEKRVPKFMIDSMPNDEQTRKVRFMFFENEGYTRQTAKEDWYMKDIENCVLKNSGKAQRSVIVPYGSKGAGKSTFMRQLINKFLSNPHSPPVFLLEADPGQTEFLPAGTMSLRRVKAPILDIPACHQEHLKESIMLAYFLGGVDVSKYIDRYKEIFDRLYNEFTVKSPVGSILIVNTMGWIIGPGSHILTHIFMMTHPLVSIYLMGGKMNHDERSTVFYVPRNNPPALKVEFRKELFVPRDGKGQGPGPGPTPAVQRDFAMLGYFLSLFSGADLASFFDEPPYGIELKHLTIVQRQDTGYIRDNWWLAAINNKLVALCGLDNNDQRKLKIRHRMLGNEDLPMLAIADNETTMLKFIGFALVRGIDSEAKQLYLHTPLDLEELDEAPLLVRGDNIELPDWIFTSQASWQLEKLNIDFFRSRSFQFSSCVYDY
ncbi:hypothetical protein WR25_20876 isoform A [Diploscapter pachys]|uniref:Clp1 P-loop domain-containing protein n=1 Tax=Diploscapter pachys TaxID=2018661 RepID=A0A2A2JPI7_9BILA|nr:hypothetical protein WR25_20876 isoform A [Diploscapter pachys]